MKKKSIHCLAKDAKIYTNSVEKKTFFDIFRVNKVIL